MCRQITETPNSVTLNYYPNFELLKTSSILDVLSLYDEMDSFSLRNEMVNFIENNRIEHLYEMLVVHDMVVAETISITHKTIC